VRVSSEPHTIDPAKPLSVIAFSSGASGRDQTTIGLDTFGFIGGHSAGLAADANGVFHALWIDNRTGRAQMWTAPITVEGTVARFGSADLANATDVTDKTELEVVRATYDPHDGVVELTARLENTSADTLEGPFMVRVLAVHSGLGQARLIAPDGSLTDRDLAIDFGAAGRLAPKQRTEPRAIRFRLAKWQPIRHGTEIRYTLFGVDSQVLARGVRKAEAGK
jgi:hypothetical protein